MKKVSKIVSKSMLFADFSEADVEMEKPRFDCAGAVQTWVGPSRKSSKIKEKTSDMLTLSALSLFLRNVIKKIIQRDLFGNL